MSAFASPEELRLALGLDEVNGARATFLLQIASDAIRGYCRQQIDAAVDEQVELSGEGQEVLLLPEIPVTALDEVQVGGEVLDASLYAWKPSGTLRRLGATWGTEQEPVVVGVTYSHGYDDVPREVKDVCLAVAGRAYTFRESAGTAEGLDGLTESAGYSPEMALTAPERKSLTAFRVRR